MGKAARNRAIRRRALELDPEHARSTARALRRHGRLPLLERYGGGGARPMPRWTAGARKFARKYADFRRPKAKR